MEDVEDRTEQSDDGDPTRSLPIAIRTCCVVLERESTVHQNQASVRRPSCFTHECNRASHLARGYFQ
jgi:hypothetical protein